MRKLSTNSLIISHTLSESRALLLVDAHWFTFQTLALSFGAYLYPRFETKFPAMV